MNPPSNYSWAGLEYTADTLTKMRAADERIMIFARCDDFDIPNPFSDEPLPKESLGYTIVVVDILVIFTLFLFIYMIERGQANFVEVFNSNTITPEDFTIKVKGIPDESSYMGSGDTQKKYRDETLKTLLYNHFQEVIKDQAEKETGQKAEEDFTNINSARGQARASP
jgi:hypothetical protein